MLNTVLKNTNFILNDQPLGSSIGPIIALCDTDHGIRRNSVVQSIQTEFCVKCNITH